MAISSAYSSALETGWSGQPGNTVPMTMPASTDVVSLEYGLYASFHRPVHLITYSSAGNTIGASYSGALLYYDGPSATAGKGFSFTLPDPQPGLWFTFHGIGAIGCTVVTVYHAASATGAFYVAGDSGGTDGVALNTTATDQVLNLEVIGLSTSKYLVMGAMNSSGPSTGAGGIHAVAAS
jgi:hypothetical protein